ncbi:MAG: FG-GAP-like repeat-containing protein [Candidatus Hydrogenedentes bacterium]|nr:FG-GAP-like repeat-containing protein [Candidatus Hydrogenedentota bacterium]
MVVRMLRILTVFSLLCITPRALSQENIGQYEDNPFVIRLEIPGPQDSAGGVIAADLDNDGRMDYLVTVPGHVAAYGNDGEKLWIQKTAVRVGGSSEREGLPGHCAPGVQAADIDGDGKTKVLYLTQDSVLHVVQGETGEAMWSAKPPVPEGAQRWEHAVVANFRGEGDRDILLQATNRDGYRTGRYVAAYALEALKEGNLEPLWQRDDFMACAHNGVRIADLDNDGKDEVLSAMVLGSDGSIRCRIPLRGHIDSVFVNDVLPNSPGLEVVALEEGGNNGNRVFLFCSDRLLWETHYQHWEPQNAAVGEFDASRRGLEIWCRSRFNEHQKPFAFDAQGQLINQYAMDDVAPDGWTVRGVELIWTIDWTGGPKQFAVATERHKAGDVAIFDPIEGSFVTTFKEKADRLYVADVSGDWREEIIVLAGNELRIYHNPAENPNPNRPRLWEQQHYGRSKMTYNYYSP